MSKADCSSVLHVVAALVPIEVTEEAVDDKQDLLITFIDTSKAFDVVSHTSMLNTLYEQDITGNLWKLYDSMYNNIQSQVMWRGHLSSAFPENQGIHQGGTYSADNHKSGKNQVLWQLDKAPSNKIRHIHTDADMVNDDLALSAGTQLDMQCSLNIVKLDASHDRYKFNTNTMKTITINCTSPPNLIVSGKSLSTSEKDAYLGILRTYKNTNIDTVQSRVKSSRQAVYILMGAGFTGLNGIGPEVALTQYKTMYCLQCCMGWKH